MSIKITLHENAGGELSASMEVVDYDENGMSVNDRFLMDFLGSVLFDPEFNEAINRSMANRSAK